MFGAFIFPSIIGSDCSPIIGVPFLSTKTTFNPSSLILYSLTWESLFELVIILIISPTFAVFGIDMFRSVWNLFPIFDVPFSSFLSKSPLLFVSLLNENCGLLSIWMFIGAVKRVLFPALSKFWIDIFVLLPKRGILVIMLSFVIGIWLLSAEFITLLFILSIT